MSSPQIYGDAVSLLISTIIKVDYTKYRYTGAGGTLEAGVAFFYVDGITFSLQREQGDVMLRNPRVLSHEYIPTELPARVRSFLSFENSSL